MFTQKDEYSSPSHEIASPVEEYCERATEYHKEGVASSISRKKKSKTTFRRFLVTAFGAAVAVGVAVTLPDKEADKIYTAVEENLSEFIPVAEETEESVTDTDVTAIIEESIPSPTPTVDFFAGMTDAEILVKQKTWAGDGITVTFLSGGNGYWMAGSDNGWLQWSENPDGTVSYTGSAALINCSSYGDSGETDYTPYTEGTPIYYIAPISCGGTVTLDRTDAQITMDNPLAIVCKTYRGSIDFESAVVSGDGVYSLEAATMLDALAETPTEELLVGTWLPNESEPKNITSVAFANTGAATVTVLEQAVAVTVEWDADNGGQFRLVGADGDITVINGENTVTFDAFQGMLLWRNGQPQLAILDMLSDSFCYELFSREEA